MMIPPNSPPNGPILANIPLPQPDSHFSEPNFAVVQAAIVQLWDVINHLSAAQPPKCERYRLSIFGSARMQPSDPLYLDVKYLAETMTKLGCDIITGGGPGLMQAANEGSVAADPDNRTQSIGLRIDLDFEQAANPYVEQLYHHQTFFSRLHHFVLLSNAFVVVPGGIGTAFEMMMVWQLLQVRKLHDAPLILVGSMWSDLVNWADRTMTTTDPPMAQPEDMKIPICVPTVHEAIAILTQEQAIWTQRCTLE
jgi:uncharacterized protein (TIGR00730 family)